MIYIHLVSAYLRISFSGDDTLPTLIGVVESGIAMAYQGGQTAAALTIVFLILGRSFEDD